MSKRVLIFTLLIILIAAIGFLVFQKAQKKAPLPTHRNIDISGQPTLNKNGKVQIVAFEDMKCSNCKRYATELYPEIKKQYIDTGEASYTTITLAFIPGSEPAANAALCAAEQKTEFYFDFTDYLFANQPDEMLNWATRETLLDFASHVDGINKEALASCMNSDRYSKRIAENMQIAQAAMPDMVATPSIFINGYKLNQLNMDAVNALVTRSS